MRSVCAFFVPNFVSCVENVFAERYVHAPHPLGQLHFVPALSYSAAVE